MPRLAISNYQHTAQLETLDWGKVGPWLAEWVQRMADPNPAMPSLRLEVYPSWDDRQQPPRPDIPGAPRTYVLDKDGARAFLRDLAEVFGVEILLPVAKLGERP